MDCGYEYACPNDCSIVITQGDYGSYLYRITNADGTSLTNLSSIIFSSSKQNVKKELSKISENEFLLELPSETTKLFIPVRCTYDITLLFDNNKTPYTIIRNASFTVLGKENPIDDG